jgi:hypothetical protein
MAQQTKARFFAPAIEALKPFAHVGDAGLQAQGSGLRLRERSGPICPMSADRSLIPSSVSRKVSSSMSAKLRFELIGKNLISSQF